MKSKFICPVVFPAVLGLSQITFAQTTYSWRAEATDGTWQLADNWWDGVQTATPAGNDILDFNNNNQLTMTNDLSNTTRHRILFAAGATSSRTISGSTSNDFVAVSGNGAMIQNNSSATHNLNFPFSAGADGLNVDTATNAFNLGGTISGTGTITKTGGSGNYTGAFNIAVTGNNASFTGKWVVNGGLLSVNGDAALGAEPVSPVSDFITLNGGGLANMSSANGTGFAAGHDMSIHANRGITLGSGGGNIRIGYGKNVTINSPITGTGNLGHTDGGTLVLAGSSNFTGNLTSSAGSLTVSGSLNHTGNLTNGSGTLAFSGSSGSTYTGFTHITGNSTLRLDVDNMMPDTTDILFYGGTTFNVNGKNETVGGVMVGSSSDTNVNINLGAVGSTGTLTVTDNSMPAGSPTNAGSTFYARITGTGGIHYAHATQIAAAAHWDWVNTANDFTGNITITQGRLRVISNATTPTDVTLGNAANDLIFNGDIVSTLGNQQGKASIQVQNGASLPLGAGRDVILNTGKEGTMYVWGGTTMTISGKVTGGGNLRKEDSGILLLNNTANDYTGLTRIALGTVRVGVTGVIPDVSTVEIAGGNLDLNNIGETVASLTGSGGAVNGGNTLTVLTSGTAEYAGAIQNATTLHMAGSGTQTIAGSGDNANGWASVASGTLVLGKTSTSSVHSVGRSYGIGLTISGGTARLGGSGNDQIYFQTDVSQSTGVFDFNGSSEGFRGLIGTGGTIRNGAADTFSTITLGEATIAGDTFTYAGVIENGSGTVELTKTGLGTQVLTGANTYTGFTSVNAGTLRVQGSLGNSPTVVAATIAGNGSIGGAVSMLSGAGIATTITDWNGSAGTGFDDLAVQSLVLDSGPHTITIDTSALVNFSETTKSFPILTTTGGITGFNALDFTVSAPGFAGTGTWSVQQAVNNLELVYTVASNAYNTWATAKNLTPANNGKTQDPDNDGRTNLQEFAFDGDPLSGANDGKIVAGLADPDGEGAETIALVITLPVRNGAVFTGPGDLVSDPVDGVIYQIQGSDDLTGFNLMDVTEVTPALVSGMPALATGWSYRTFRTPGSPAEPDPRDFLRVGVIEEPEP